MTCRTLVITVAAVLFSLNVLTAQNVATAPTQSKSSSANLTKQCSGTTTKGVQCKIKVSDDQTLCRLHHPHSPRCEAPTSSGGNCKRLVKTAGIHCKQHQ